MSTLDLDLDTAAFMATDEVVMFERTVRGFVNTHVRPEDLERWRGNKRVDLETWQAAAEAGLLGVSVPEEYGGSGGDFRHEAVILKEIGHAGGEVFGISLHNAVILPYLVSYGTDLQKRTLLPRLCSGELISAIAMTEPGAGSDLQGMRMTARRGGAGYLLNGQKTFISNGQIANLILVAAKTDPAAGSKAISLFCVETDKVNEGFRRGRNLDKIGQEGQDTSELFFDNMLVPENALLGGIEGAGLGQLMAKLPQERLMIAWQAVAMIERGLAETISYTRDRRIFGQRLADFQNTQFKLAEFKTMATAARVFVNDCTRLLVEGRLDAARASMAKYWITDLASEIIDGCLQFFGGYGYMNEYPIARLYRDVRVLRIYGGTSEVMKMLIARSL
jgi:acyl-CoA dehydrogenase